MKLLFLFLVPILGTCKGGLFDDVDKNECMWRKMQQCMGQLLLSAPDLFWSGPSKIDLKTKNEFGDCLTEMSSCPTGLFNTINRRSEKQKEFCGDNQDCYDDEEDEEDKYSGFNNCVYKNLNLVIRDIADSTLDVLGNIRHMFSPKSEDKHDLTLNNVMCHVIRRSLHSVHRIAVDICGGDDHELLLMTGMVFKSVSPYLYELCSIQSELKKLILS